MYPSIILEHKVYPEHLGPEFLDVYRGIKEERIVAKKAKDKLKDTTLKLSINGLSGNLQSEYSWCYSPKTALTIRINGQLMLLMLAEAIHCAGGQLVNTNTDGTFFKAKKSLKPKLLEIKDWWEKKTKLVLESDEFEAFYQFAINDYLGLKKGYSETKDPSLIKKKGLFIDTVSLGRGMAPMIIPKAINAKLIDNIPPEETVYKETDIRNFLTYQKVSKDYEVEYMGELVRHINRYYMSRTGGHLYKCKVNKETGQRTNYISMCSSGVTLLNEFDEMPISERKINYSYYLTEIYKILEVLETKQLTLF